MSLLVYKSAKGTTVTNSILFAKAFLISHKEALRKCANLSCDAEFNRTNYAPITYLDRRNRVQRAVMMTKEGFTYLALSLTGSKAAAFRQKYIHQFEAVDNQLRSTSPPATPLPDFTKPVIQVQQVKAAAAYLFGFGAGVGEVMRPPQGRDAPAHGVPAQRLYQECRGAWAKNEIALRPPGFAPAGTRESGDSSIPRRYDAAGSYAGPTGRRRHCGGAYTSFRSDATRWHHPSRIT